jgi:hypothetical protein
MEESAANMEARIPVKSMVPKAFLVALITKSAEAVMVADVMTMMKGAAAGKLLLSSPCSVCS